MFIRDCSANGNLIEPKTREERHMMWDYFFRKFEVT